MKYDFDQVIDRSGNRSSKYDERVKKFGTDRGDSACGWRIWTFKTAQPIIDACMKKAEEGIWGYTSRPASYFEAVQGWEKRRNNWDAGYFPDELEPGRGAGPVRAGEDLYPRRRQGADPDARLLRVLRRDRGMGPRRLWKIKLVEENGTWHIDFEDFETKGQGM